MTSTATESATARVALLQEKLQGLTGDLAAVQASLAEMPEKQHAARIAAIRKAPKLFAGTVGGDPLRLEATEQGYRKKERNILKELDATYAVLADESRRKETEQLRPLITLGGDLSKREAAIWAKLGELEAKRMVLVEELFQVVEERDGLLLEHEAEIASCEDRTLAADVLDALTPLVQPFASDPLEVALRVIEGTSRQDYRDGGMRLDGRDILIGVLPDLRHLHRKANLSSRVDKAWSERRGIQGWS